MTHLLIFLAGAIALIIGASTLVRGASGLALRLGLSPLVVGLTVVAFGTSAPEMAVSTSAVLSGQPGLAVGNAVGSNIFNVLCVLGLAAAITPLAVHQQLIRQDAAVMIGGAVLLLVLGLDGGYGAFDGILLLALLLAYTSFVVQQSRAESFAANEQQGPPAAPSHWSSKLPAQLALIAVGLVLLVGGSEAMVSSAVVFARAWGVSETVIGLTIVAAGTSLPEAAASIAASLKGERDMAVGNVVGSCIFNIFGVVGLAATVAAFVGGSGGWLLLPPDVAQFDLWVMLAALVACLPLFITGSRIARWEGLLLFGYYIAYTVYLVLAAKRHEGVQAFGDAMIGFVIPLTIVTLFAALLRRPDQPA